MKAFVTGATGFIGQNLVKRLIADSWEVSVLIRSKGKMGDLDGKKVNIVSGDLTDLSKVKNALKKNDVVFNLAAVLMHHKLPEKKYWETNVTGLENLLKIYQNSNIKRFVHVSTVGIYGPTGGKMLDESSPIHPSDIYSRTKATAENLLFRYYKKTGFPMTIVRPTIAFGPGDLRPGFSNLFPLVKKKLFIPIGDGKNFFHTVYVENLVQGLILAATHKNAIGEDFIIGDDPCPTMEKLIRTIAEVEGVTLFPLSLPQDLALLIGKAFDLGDKFNIPQVLNSKRVKFITENRKYDISKAKKLIGYHPFFDLKTGIQKTFDWYQEKGLI